MVSPVSEALLNKLRAIVSVPSQTLYVALSGGIDSLTLMTIASSARSAPTVAVHAKSSAVPPEATDRCRELCNKYNWSLIEINAGEFDNSQYLSNPVNRCYYCKSSLFDSIKAYAAEDHLIATGTNTDDLGDYRPGLIAAKERGIWQPYVEAGIDKAAIRQLAVISGLGELSQLPAQPCLSSRVETGIRIDVGDLKFIHKVESALSQHLGSGDIRCRIVSDGVVAQLPADSDVFVSKSQHQSVTDIVQDYCTDEGRRFLRFEPYRMGSAFLTDGND